MKAENHAIIGVPVAVAILYFTHNWFYFAVALLAGVFVDADHVFDYIMDEKKFDFEHMFIKSYKGDFKRMYLLAHAYEYIPIAWIIGLTFKKWELPLIFSIAYLFHMIPDQLANNVRPWGYFITFRIAKNWRTEDIFYPPKAARTAEVEEMERKLMEKRKKSG